MMPIWRLWGRERRLERRRGRDGRGAKRARRRSVLGAADELAAEGRFVEAMHVLLLQGLADIRAAARRAVRGFAHQPRNPPQHQASRGGAELRCATSSTGWSGPISASTRRHSPTTSPAARASTRWRKRCMGMHCTEARRAKRSGMTGEPVFSRRLLIGWIAGAVVMFAISLYLMGAGEMTGPDSTGASTFSRSAIGHAGIAEVLTAARNSGRQEPIQFAGEALARQRAGDRRAAACAPIGRGHPHAAQGQARSCWCCRNGAGSRASRRTDWLRQVERAQRSATRNGRSTWSRRAPTVVRESMKRGRQHGLEHECARPHPEPRLADPADARDRPAADHRLRPRHAHRRDQRPQSQDLGAVRPRRHLQSRPRARAAMQRWRSR